MVTGDGSDPSPTVDWVIIIIRQQILARSLLAASRYLSYLARKDAKML